MPEVGASRASRAESFEVWGILHFCGILCRKSIVIAGLGKSFALGLCHWAYSLEQLSVFQNSHSYLFSSVFVRASSVATASSGHAPSIHTSAPDSHLMPSSCAGYSKSSAGPQRSADWMPVSLSEGMEATASKGGSLLRPAGRISHPGPRFHMFGKPACAMRNPRPPSSMGRPYTTLSTINDERLPRE